MCVEYSDDEARIIRLRTFQAGKEKGLEEGRKQGALEVAKEIRQAFYDYSESGFTDYINDLIKDLKK